MTNSGFETSTGSPQTPAAPAPRSQPPGDEPPPLDLAPDVLAGQALYSPFILACYDVAVLGVANRWVWRCPSARIRRLYNANVTGSHVDVGVGTGYFLDHATWPVDVPSITLVDLNKNSLAAAARRVARFQPRTARRNALAPLGELPGAPYASASINYLLHCIPGELEDKADRVLSNLAPMLQPDAVVFGSTILAPDRITPRVARAVMALYNRRGIFQNSADHLDGLKRALARRFTSHQVEVVGSVALFTGRRPLPTGGG